MSLIESSRISVVDEANAGGSPFADTSRYARQLHWALLLLCASGLAAALLLRVEQGTKVSVPLLSYTLPELCYWRQVFDLDCPGCGLTRCFVSLARADLASAWHYNPAGILLFGCMVLQIPFRGWQLWRLRRGQREVEIAALPWLLVAVSVLMILQWLVRMIW